MSGQIGDEGARGDVHGLGLAEERGAEPRALDLDQVEAGILEGNADNFHGVGTAGLGQAEGLHGRAGGKRGEHGALAIGSGKLAEPGKHLSRPIRRDPQDLASHPLAHARRP